MRCVSAFLLMFLLVLWSSCRSDFESEEFSGKLKFSRDTVFLDTVFSNLSTSTYALKVYNLSNEDIHIPELGLKNGENSMYRLNVDGIPGKIFENIEILARDSIYIFIETTVSAATFEAEEFLYLDLLQFRSKNHVQEVPLVTLVKDAIFLFPAKDAQGFSETISIGENAEGKPQEVTGFYLPEQRLKFTANKAYVIYGYAAVPKDETLVVEAGARIHFHENSGILVPEGASIQVKGELSMNPAEMEKEVIFEGDRLQGAFAELPGQWGAIWLRPGSKNNLFQNTTIKNASVGILVEGNTNSLIPLQLHNVQIYNSAISGILAENADISGKNLVINRSGRASLHLTGGKHSFIHATIVNYWQQNFRDYPALFLENNTTEKAAPLEAAFYNSIIFGNEKKELGFNIDEEVEYDLRFSHSLIKFNSSGENAAWFDFSNENIYSGILINQEPLFINASENDLRLKELSAAIDRGAPEFGAQVPLDISGNDRTSAPDLGAYEFKEDAGIKKAARKSLF
ncbi:choice-of-anchor Q domain-containing protein [Salinimicrobium oceani]|uniref:Right handed beta helix region n=1 Tax=Salinimicrobium oceani TaxID=2722702 RepID=A0ABX1CT22_9FLAO|nr:choice-of-anchor Q domain-containing protein [Salinimicrobium oceani]NJW51432.1 hypothetical protein [Salinimicrobium oceani]